MDGACGEKSNEGKKLRPPLSVQREGSSKPPKLERRGEKPSVP